MQLSHGNLFYSHAKFGSFTCRILTNFHMKGFTLRTCFETEAKGNPEIAYSLLSPFQFHRLLDQFSAFVVFLDNQCTKKKSLDAVQNTWQEIVLVCREKGQERGGGRQAGRQLLSSHKCLESSYSSHLGKHYYFFS